jgi:hypothetical protein
VIWRGALAEVGLLDGAADVVRGSGLLRTSVREAGAGLGVRAAGLDETGFRAMGSLLFFGFDFDTYVSRRRLTIRRRGKTRHYQIPSSGSNLWDQFF